MKAVKRNEKKGKKDDSFRKAQKSTLDNFLRIYLIRISNLQCKLSSHIMIMFINNIRHTEF